MFFLKLYINCWEKNCIGIWISLKKCVFFKAEQVLRVSIQNENNLHSISRYMLFWCPPILLAASQSYLPESDNFTSLICRDELPCCPLTSRRPSGLCLHRVREKKYFMFRLCKMMTKNDGIYDICSKQNELLPAFNCVCVLVPPNLGFLYLWFIIPSLSILPVHLLTGRRTVGKLTHIF